LRHNFKKNSAKFAKKIDSYFQEIFQPIVSFPQTTKLFWPDWPKSPDRT